MKELLKNHVLIVIAWFFIAIGCIGVFLPILPTTPFLIVALALFSKSSPRFHQMLLNNPWFGDTLKQWEATKTLPRKIKYKASFVIVITFAISIMMFIGDFRIQIILICIALAVLFFIWRIKEVVVGSEQ